ncbi:unnamed protein product [Protopolystoma xenopodis]|uniref:Uncharacterized protein n=1 Tax=Protopolystoma xenopodis TaxID=117903 RepID=A0A3S5CJF5_9PLAT|nr:unnamed protein product [Protopolystoma xenopodis]
MLFIFAAVLLLLLSLISYLYLSRSVIFVIDHNEADLCPACFGQSACPAFFRGDVTFDSLLLRLGTFGHHLHDHLTERRPGSEVYQAWLG